MLAEFLSEQGEWAQVMPGARACLFSLCERSFPLPLRLEGWFGSEVRYPAGASPHRHL